MKNFVWLISCKTGNTSFKSFLSKYLREVQTTFHHKIWEGRGARVIGIYYPFRDALERLKKIENPIFFTIIRNPEKRIISAYKFVKEIRNIRFNRFHDFLKTIIDLNKSITPNQYFRIRSQDEKNFLIEHTRPLSEVLSQMKLGVDDISFVLETEFLDREAPLFLQKNFGIDGIMTFHTHATKKDKVEITEEDKTLIDEMFFNDFEVYETLKAKKITS